jgi:hypothetical protein
MQNLELDLTTFLDFKEQSRITGFSFDGYNFHKKMLSLMPIIQDLQNHMLSLEHQFLKQTHLVISLDPFYLKPNYDTFTTSDEEFGCNEYHDHILILNDQPISHIPNTNILETNRQNKSQYHGLPQISHSYA